MRQLSGLDTSFLNMETATTYGHIGTLAVYDQRDVDSATLIEGIKRTFLERLHLLRPYRCRLAEVPLGLDRPYWFVDPDFDIDFHVRHIAVPPPGGRAQLSELIARLHARPLDRSRPLWEHYVIEGLEGGRYAQYTKIHHAAIDGVSGANAAIILGDLDPAGTPVPLGGEGDERPEAVPTQAEMLARGWLGLARNPLRAMQWNYRALRALPALRRALPPVSELRRRYLGETRGEGEVVLSRPTTPAPRTPLNQPISPHRRYAYGTVPLADVKAVKNAFGTTLNDVVMAASAATLRRWLRSRDALPEDPLLAAVPVSVRAEDAKGEYGNQVSTMIAVLPTHLEDPIARLRAAHEAMKGAKEQHGALPATLLTDATQFLPPALAGLAARTASRMRITDYVTPPFNVLISNVPGPRQTLYSVGTELLAMYPVSAIADGGALNMTVYSYRDSLDFGFIACREVVPDLWDLAGFFEESIAELVALAADAGPFANVARLPPRDAGA